MNRVCRIMAELSGGTWKQQWMQGFWVIRSSRIICIKNIISKKRFLSGSTSVLKKIYSLLRNKQSYLPPEALFHSERSALALPKPDEQPRERSQKRRWSIPFQIDIRRCSAHLNWARVYIRFVWLFWMRRARSHERFMFHRTKVRYPGDKFYGHCKLMNRSSECYINEFRWEGYGYDNF